MHAPGVAPAVICAALKAVSATPSQLASSACSLESRSRPEITADVSVTVTLVAPVLNQAVRLLTSTAPIGAFDGAFTFTNRVREAPTASAKLVAPLTIVSEASRTPAVLPLSKYRAE